MLGRALRDPNPVFIFEHALLYPMEGELEADDPLLDLHCAVVRRPGADLTIITHGGSLWKCLQAAQRLADGGIEAEVIDLRSLRPLDLPTLLQSVAKTHRALVVDEGWRTCGLAAEISARIMEEGFYDLDAPVARLCSAEVPLPYPKHLEDAALPQPESIEAAARQLVAHHA
jgi:pyruvate dehydrogenase E1 component beta subunit